MIPLLARRCSQSEAVVEALEGEGFGPDIMTNDRDDLEGTKI